MRIKIGDQWYEAKSGQPVMLILSPQDKLNIANMAPEATRYAIFDDADGGTAEQKLAWMVDDEAAS